MRKISRTADFTGVPEEAKLSAVISVKHFGHCTLLRGVHTGKRNQERWSVRRRVREERVGEGGGGGEAEGEKQRDREGENIRHPGWLVRLCPTDDVHDQAPPTHMPPANAHNHTHSYTRAYLHTYA